MSRLKRELADARMERDLPPNPPRTLRRRSCAVRTHDVAARATSLGPPVSDFGGVSEWQSCLERTSLFPARVGRIKRLRKKCGYAVVSRGADSKPPRNRITRYPWDNLLGQTFATTQPNKTWVTDITYVPTAEGWLYLAGIKDLYTCEVVGHAMDAPITTDLVSHALARAMQAKRPRLGLIHHSDRGSQDRV